MKKKVLVIGPSDTGSFGGMAAVIRDIRNSETLNSAYDIDIHESFIDGNILVRLAFSIFSYLKFLTYYKKYDLFHIHSTSNGSAFRKSYYLKTLKKANKKVIVHNHAALFLVFYEGLNDKRKQQIRDYFQGADMVLALSDVWKEKYKEALGISNCQTLNNGIDDTEFIKAVCDMEKHRNEFVVLGRLGERKGTYDLIEAVKIAKQYNANIKIYLAGDGEIDKVKDIVSNENLTDNIQIIGWADHSKKMELLKSSATLVLPSHYEGLPIAILEGMAAGKAIISTTVGSIPEVVTNENGILVEAGDVNALSEALIKCSTDLEMLNEMKENNIEKIKKEFSVRKMHELLAEYYEEVLKNE